MEGYRNGDGNGDGDRGGEGLWSGINFFFFLVGLCSRTAICKFVEICGGGGLKKTFSWVGFSRGENWSVRAGEKEELRSWQLLHSNAKIIGEGIRHPSPSSTSLLSLSSPPSWDTTPTPTKFI